MYTWAESEEIVRELLEGRDTVEEEDDDEDTVEEEDEDGMSTTDYECTSEGTVEHDIS